MKRPLLALLTLSAAAGLALANRPAPDVTSKANPVPVVVELFTSEGCSSCPAADAALRELAAAQSVPGAEVIALGQHVDYWNRLGWRDPFSSPQFTERQRWYAAGFGEGSYTPQAVVNGRYQFVGSQRNTLAQTVAKAAQETRAAVDLSQPSANAIAVKISDLPTGAKAAQVLLALTESGLSTQVRRGENSGRLLRHAAVVRTLRPLGEVGRDGTFATTVPIKLQRGWKAENLRAVVLVQEPGTRHIVGAAALALQ